MKVRKIEISHKTIIFTVIFLLSLVVLWQIRDIITLIFVSFVLMQAINPMVVQIQRIKIPRLLAIVISYFFIFGVIAFVVAGIVPILIEQTTALFENFPQWFESFKIFSQNNIDFSSQFQFLQNIPSNITKVAISVVSNIFAGFMVLVITFYLLLEKNNFPKYSDNFFGEKGREKFLKVMNLLESRLGSWVSAQLLLMVIIGILSFVGYSLLGLKYAVPLAIFAGLLEALPTIGPTISTIIVGLVGLTISPLTALFAVLFGILIQQLENTFIVPKLMSKTVGLNPIFTIVLISAGATLAGFAGAVLAIPLFITIESIFKGLSKDSP